MTVDILEEIAGAPAAASACPFHSVGAEFSPLSAAHLANPYRFYDRAQREEPVFFSSMLNCWVVTRYEDISAALRDWQRFSSAGAFSSAIEFAPETKAILSQGIPLLEHAMTNNDPPRHTRIRSSVNKVFSAQRVASFEPRIRAIAERMIDSFVAAGQGNLVELFNYPFPAVVIFDIIGVPEADLRQVKEWCVATLDLLVRPMPAEQQAECARSALAYQRYIVDLIEQRRLAPRDDLTSDLVKAIDAGEVDLSMDELVELLFDLVVAGHETTANLLGNSLLQLLPDRALWHTIGEDPRLARKVVEEAIRFEGPAIGFFRITTTDVELRGTTIPKGSPVFLLYGAANHDAAQFPNPHLFDPQRENAAKHLGFGAGIHFCLGAPLARLEMRIALEALSRRIPSMRLVGGQALAYRPNLAVRGLEGLLVEWKAG
jgi:cytochrome P450